MKRVIPGQTIAPYSPAVIFDERLIFVSGQIPGKNTGDIEQQAKEALDNLKSVLAKAGAGLEAVLKTTVFLKDMQDFAKFNEVYKKYFQADPPARSTVQVADLPMGVKIEIEAIAYLNK